jgi:hypothetical protein
MTTPEPDQASTLTISMAAKTLHQMFPARTADGWAMWLQNNRNQTRAVPYRIPFTRAHGAVMYARADLDRFAEWERSKSLGKTKLTDKAAAALAAYGIGTDQGGAYGRALSCMVTPAATEAGVMFVRLTIDNPLAVFRLGADQAAAIGQQLLDAAGQVRTKNLVQSSVNADAAGAHRF